MSHPIYISIVEKLNDLRKNVESFSYKVYPYYELLNLPYKPYATFNSVKEICYELIHIVEENVLKDKHDNFNQYFTYCETADIRVEVLCFKNGESECRLVFVPVSFEK